MSVPEFEGAASGVPNSAREAAFNPAPRRLHRVCTFARELGRMGVSEADALDEIEDAIFANGLLPADRASQSRAWRVGLDAAQAAYAAGAREATFAMAVAALADASGDPIAAVRPLMASAALFATDEDVTDALGLVWADAFISAVRKAIATGEPEWTARAEDEEVALRFELEGWARLQAKRAADTLLAEADDEPALVEALMAVHPLVTRQIATDVAVRALKRHTQPPQPRYEPDAEELYSGGWREPDSEAVALHERAAAVLGARAMDAPAAAVLQSDERAGGLDLADPANWRNPPAKLFGTLRSIDFDPTLESRPPSWLVKGIAPRAGLGLLYGESGAGKTFLAIHAALSVAWGLPFFGHRAKQGGVLYVAAEGGSSVLPRIRAANDVLGGAVAASRLSGQHPTRAPLRIVTEAPNLSRDGDAKPLVRTIRQAQLDFEAAGHRLALVVVDTWHAAMGGGDENSAADAGAALAPLRDASEAGGFLTLILHHPGKDVERGPRGSNAVMAAVDAAIELRVPGFEGAKPKSGAMRKATVIKMRDGESGETFSYRLPTVQIGADEDGDPWTTCIVQPCAEPKLDEDGLTPAEREFMNVMRAALGEARGDRVQVREVRLRFYAGRADAKPDARRIAFNRALASALKADRIGVDDTEEWAWLN